MLTNPSYRSFFIKVIICLAFGIGYTLHSFAIQEPYLNELKGANVVAGNHFAVADEKFVNAGAWGLIQQNMAVNNIISFEINFDTSVYFYAQPFECTINFKVYIYGNQSDTSQVTDSTTHANISLQVRYDTLAGVPYKGIAMYKFMGAHKYKVKIISITSPQLSPIPAIFRLKGQVIVDRQYKFEDNTTDITRYSVVNGNQLRIDWTPSLYPGAEQFDLEYTHIDGASGIAASIRSYESGGAFFIPQDSLSTWFLNNNTRITTANASYLLNIPYDSGFVLFRIRGTQIHYPDNLRWEGNWNYLAREAVSSCSTCPSGAVFFNPHESNLNWQYAASFAEEGKRKEVISYFDGSMRNRQSVTINNSDNKNIVQEPVYDALGRAAVNILPAPVKDSTIHYFKNFNRNKDDKPYSFADLLYVDCFTTADSLSAASGAGRYYSPNNDFLSAYHYAKYIPSAAGYPLAATEFMADNTGRVKAQGGVGPTFQLHAGHATRYFYGKPSQTELDRLFGTEAGNASHYLKNMVVDPNGQISVSYLNASGRTIATALAGAVPPNTHALPSTTDASTQLSDELLGPDDFSKEPADYSVQASSTFLAPVTGTYSFHYRVDPLKMVKLFGPDKDTTLCNTCYYSLEIIVKDDCNNIIQQELKPAGTIFDTSCATVPVPLADSFDVSIGTIGEYYISYRLVISREGLDFYDSTHLVKNSDIKRLNYFLLEELKQTDFYACYSQCETCLGSLGSKDEFTSHFRALYTTDSLSFTVDDSLFVANLYDSLYAHCLSIQGNCATNVCDEKLRLLKMDVSPGGQYALYDSSNNLLEPAINILSKRSQIAFFTDEYGNRDSVDLFTVSGEDSARVDVKSLNDSQFLDYWKDEWADSLVRLHPEYCHYLWCTVNSSSYEFEREIKNWLDADTAMARGWFSPAAYDTILTYDPFFLPGGNGFLLRDQMRDTLRLLSRSFARTSLADKNILQFIDIALYCKDQYDGWNSCNPDSSCRSRNREWFLYQQFYLNLKLKFYEYARLTSSNTVFSNCTNCYIGKDIIELAGMTRTDTADYIPFVPENNNCSYSCPAGTYAPYYKPGVSIHITSGSPKIAPTGVPAGYGGCQFFNAYDLRTGSNNYCRFYNVWVCMYDTSCGGICEVTTINTPSQCPDNPNAVLYQNKVRRYPEYVNSDAFINGVLASNPKKEGEAVEQISVDECYSNCEAQADVWIRQLSRCSTDSLKLVQLKQALIDICTASCNTDRLYGASSIPDSVTATYHSFEEAIEGILGPGAVNDSCTVALLGNAYPHNSQPAYVEPFIAETNYEICQKITQYKTAWQSSGQEGSFHSWLLRTYPNGYQLDSLELDDLLNSCTNCNGILKDEVALPVMFTPGASPCLLCDSVQTALLAFNSKFPSLSNSSPDYEILFSNFFNQRFGYSLTFLQYQTYLDSCTENISYSVRLCNEPTTKEVSVDINGNGCTASLFASALTAATNTYLVYIDSVRRDFREAYMTKCMNVQPSLNMTAELFEYHYTLYYYDQSGNLVKTVPPEGVFLLNSDSLELVKLHRLLQNEGCYRYSDSILFNNNGQVAWDIAPYAEAGIWTAEMFTNLTTYADQVIVSKFSEYQYDTTAGVGFFYRHTGFIVKVESGKLAVDLYGIGSDTIQHKALAVSVRGASEILPLNTWTHFTAIRTGIPGIPVQLWVNGNPVALEFTFNDIDSAEVFSGDSALIAGSYEAPNFAAPSRLQGAIKNLRIYKRALGAAEIRQNAYNLCQTPVNFSELAFWSPMNRADSNQVLDLVSSKEGILSGFNWVPFLGIFPPHRLPTFYEYNSLNQVLSQYSPDGNASTFWYDRLGRLTASQNKEQEENTSYSGTANRFSYTKYDPLGRITEVGEKSSPSEDVRSINMLDTTEVQTWLASGIDRQVTKTIYDNPVNFSIQTSSTSRKRVVASVYLENATDVQGDSTLYDYDINGNVTTLLQYIKALVAADASNGKKRIDYDFDLVSGKVNEVRYQQGKGDQFFYKYQYDADNRITCSYSSRDRLIWNEDASYQYYLHGPLARMELGHLKIQGVDYAYTLQGWLKGTNGDSLNTEKEMGTDGNAGSVFSRVSRDVYSTKLGYYNNDYTAIGGSGAEAFTQRPYTAPSTLEATGNQLFNGNIGYTTLALSKINAGRTTGYSYGYDQLNRLTEMRQHTAAGGWSNSNIIAAYRESISYDANGNILKYLRNGTASKLAMDSLNYRYNRDIAGHLINNKLNYVKDSVNSAAYSTDIDNQEANNYSYDEIGNLIKDNAEGIDSIRWTVYGKINRIAKSNASYLNYGYDAGGNRTFKQYKRNDTLINTYYVRDAQGNVLGIYQKKQSDVLKWSEQHIYGSSRLGIWNNDQEIAAAPPVAVSGPVYDSILFGSKAYELTNHLGNVLATVSDKKTGHDSSGVVNYYVAEVLSQNDYYPFGMLMSGKGYTHPVCHEEVQELKQVVAQSDLNSGVTAVGNTLVQNGVTWKPFTGVLGSIALDGGTMKVYPTTSSNGVLIDLASFALANTTYEVEFDITEKTAGILLFYCSVFNTGNQITRVVAQKTATGHYKLVFTTTASVAGLTFRVATQEYGAGYYFKVDNFIMRKFTLVNEVSQFSANFNTANMAGVNVDDNGQLWKPKYPLEAGLSLEGMSGSQKVKVTATTANKSYLETDFDLAGGKEYLLRFTVAQAVTDKSVRMDLLYKIGSTWYYSSTRAQQYLSSGSYMINYAHPESATALRISFYRFGDGVSHDYTIDDVSVNRMDTVGSQIIRVCDEGGMNENKSGMYRYGFNGKENDNEVKGEGNQQDYGERIYDPRIGKFLSTDPVSKIYPWYTPYQFAGNKPIWKIDLDGKEEATPEHTAMQAAYLTVSAVYDVRNATTNSLLRIAPGLNAAATQKLLSEAGVSDNALLKELTSYYNARVRTIVTGSYEDISGNRYEFYERMWLLEPKNSVGKEFLEAGLDVLSVASALTGPKGSPTLLFAKGGAAITMSQIRKSFSILFNVRRYSSVGVDNALKGVHSLDDVLEAGMAFVGNNAKKIYTKGGRFEGWESRDGLKRFRPARFKKNQDKIQSNFEQRTSREVDWDDAKGAKSNMHVQTDTEFDYSKERKPLNSN